MKNFSMINVMKCCNIFQVHECGASSKPILQSRRIIGLEMTKKNSESAGLKTLFLVKKLCSRCFTKAGKVGFKECSTSEDSESSASPVTKDLQSAILITEKEASTANLDKQLCTAKRVPTSTIAQHTQAPKIKVFEQKMEEEKEN